MRKEVREQFVNPGEERAVVPVFFDNAVRLLQVALKHVLHLRGEFVAQNHRIYFIVLGKTPEIQIGGTNGGPYSVYDGSLGMEDRIPEFIQLDTRFQQVVIVILKEPEKRVV